MIFEGFLFQREKLISTYYSPNSHFAKTTNKFPSKNSGEASPNLKKHSKKIHNSRFALDETLW
jgi:hypothetical protein